MTRSFTRSRARLAAIAAAVAVVAISLLPGTWSTAVAQTTPAPGATPTTSTAPDGSTTTVTTLPNGSTVTEVVKPDGTTSTTTVEPTGRSTLVVEVPNQGTVTVVQAPGEPVTVTVAPANPNTDTSMQVDVLAAQLNVPAGALSADETILIIEQSFDIAIVLGFTDESRNGSASPAAETGNLQTALQALQAEPGSITAIRVFEMTVRKPDGSTGQIAKPILMTWDFSPEDLAAAGGDYANLLMLGYNEATQKWTPATQVSYTATSATFEVPHFSLWAFAVRNALPGATVPAPAATGSDLVPTSGGQPWLAIALGLVAASAAAGGTLLARRRAQ